jgi:hypothetical protein
MTRRKIDAALKAKIALEAVREVASVADLAQRLDLAQRYGVRPAVILRRPLAAASLRQ